jgi:hypothetical protein
MKRSAPGLLAIIDELYPLHELELEESTVDVVIEVDTAPLERELESIQWIRSRYMSNRNREIPRRR